MITAKEANREILFKAKRKNWAKLPKERQWIEGFYCHKQETTYCFTEDYERHPVKTQHYIIRETMTDWGLPNEFKLIEIDPKTLCQFTGLYDKEGNKIWEHDIVCMEYIDGSELGYIQYNSSNVRFVYCEKEDGEIRKYGFGDTCTMKVVGNIFDNPELIKEE